MDAAFWRQFLTTLVGAMPNALFGALMVWPSYSLQSLEAADGELSTPLSQAQRTLVGSMPQAGALLGTVLAPPLLERLGRARAAALCSLPFVASWCCVQFSHWAPLVLAARLIGGVGGGLTLIVSPVFVSETAEERSRGFLASSTVWLYGAGVLLSYILGWVLPYRYVAAVMLGLSAISGLLAACLRNTPTHLLRQGDTHQALRSLGFYRARDPQDKLVLAEFADLRAQVQSTGGGEELRELAGNTKMDEGEQPPAARAVTGFAYLRQCAGSRRALLLASTLVVLQAWMGMGSLQVYANSIFKPTGAPDLCSVLLAIVFLVGGLSAGCAVERVGRKSLMVALSAAAAVCLATIGALMQTQVGPAWLLPAIVFLFCFVYNVGPGTVPFVLLADMFVPEVQGACTSVAISTLFCANSLLLTVFPFMEATLSAGGVFYVFAGIAAFTAALAAAIMPETKGRTPQQLLAILAPTAPSASV